MSRKSIVTAYTDDSIISGVPRECIHELVFGKGIRDRAIEDGLTIPLTNEEHNTATKPEDRIHGNPRAEDLSKIAGQLAWEKEYYRSVIHGEGDDPARGAFRRRYGISFL